MLPAAKYSDESKAEDEGKFLGEEEDDALIDKEDHRSNREDDRYALIDVSMEKIGFGKFQYGVIILTGFGTFVDALEANLISILYPVFMKTHFASSYMDLAMVSSLQALGMLVGSALLGVLSDRIGRRTVYLITLVLVVLFGLISSFAETVTSFALLRFLLGFGYGGNSNTSTNLMLEMMPNDKRGVGAAFHGMFWGLGSLVIASIAWAGGDSLDWRWLVRVPSIIAIPVLFAVCWLPESPRFYVHVDANERISASLTQIARQNSRPVPQEASMIALDAARESMISRQNRLVIESSWFQRNCSSITKLTSSKRYLTLLAPLGLVWLLQGIGHTVITWLPLHSLSLVSTTAGKQQEQSPVFVTAFVSALGVVLASACALLWLTSFRRQLILRSGLVLSIAFTFGVAFAPDLPSLYAMAFFICFAAQVGAGALYLYTPELLQTSVRTTGLGFCLALYRVGAVFAPFIAAVLTDTRSFTVTSCAFASFYAGAFFSSLCINVNTVNIPLKERASRLQE